MQYKTRKNLRNGIRFIILLFLAFVTLFPLVVVLSSSFKNESELFDFPFSFIAKNPVMYNFTQLKENFPLYTWNSVKLTVIIVALQLFTSSTGAYVMSKMHWKGRDTVFMMYLMSMMIPGQAIIIPQFIIIRNLHMYDTHWALICVGAFSAFGTFLIRQFMMSIPDTYSEAARIDGASEWKIYGNIIMPMSRSVMITQMIFSFRYFWNDFFNPLIYLTSQKLKTLPLGMSDFVREQYVYWGPQMAAALISIIPVIIIFIFGQKYFIQGVSASGIK
ncbi:MAG: carbohydrate ABC transporter permease [Sphaerochaetaceae bacterium]